MADKATICIELRNSAEALERKTSNTVERRDQRPFNRRHGTTGRASKAETKMLVFRQAQH